MGKIEHISVEKYELFQMTRLFVQYLAIYNNKNVPKRENIIESSWLNVLCINYLFTVGNTLAKTVFFSLRSFEPVTIKSQNGKKTTNVFEIVQIKRTQS